MPDAGWYDDPVGEGELRFWDGGAWTAGVRGRKQALVPRVRERSLLGTAGVALAALAVVLTALLLAASMGSGTRPSLGPRYEPSPTSTVRH